MDSLTVALSEASSKIDAAQAVIDDAARQVLHAAIEEPQRLDDLVLKYRSAVNRRCRMLSAIVAEHTPLRCHNCGHTPPVPHCCERLAE